MLQLPLPLAVAATFIIFSTSSFDNCYFPASHVLSSLCNNHRLSPGIVASIITGVCQPPPPNPNPNPNPHLVCLPLPVWMWKLHRSFIILNQFLSIYLLHSWGKEKRRQKQTRKKGQRAEGQWNSILIEREREHHHKERQIDEACLFTITQMSTTPAHVHQKQKFTHSLKGSLFKTEHVRSVYIEMFERGSYRDFMKPMGEWGGLEFFLRHNQTQILHLNCNTLILITPHKLQWVTDWEGLSPERERERGRRSDCRQRQPVGKKKETQS